MQNVQQRHRSEIDVGVTHRLAPGSIGIDEGTVGRQTLDEVIGVVEYIVIALLALSEFFFNQFLLLL